MTVHSNISAVERQAGKQASAEHRQEVLGKGNFVRAASAPRRLALRDGCMRVGLPRLPTRILCCAGLHKPLS
jgi:hypothetical protein